MVVEWSTDTIAPPLRFEAWREACCSNVYAMTLERQGHAPFNAGISRICAGPLDVADVRCDAHAVRRSQADIDAGPAETYFVYVQGAGRAWFEQNGRFQRVEQGDIVIANADLPFATGAEGTFDFRLWRVPKARIEPMFTSRMAQFPMITLSHGQGENLLIRTWLNTLVHNSPRLSGASLELAFGALCALVAQVAGMAPEMQEQGRESRRNAQLQRVMKQIELRACDIELTTQKLAADLAISKRTLYQLFGQSDTTFHEHLTQVRLGKAYELLLDPARNCLSTVEIGLASGFGEASTFYRRFKARYGITPGELRTAEVAAAH